MPLYHLDYANLLLFPLIIVFPSLLLFGVPIAHQSAITNSYIVHKTIWHLIVRSEYFFT